MLILKSACVLCNAEIPKRLLLYSMVPQRTDSKNVMFY